MREKKKGAEGKSAGRGGGRGEGVYLLVRQVRAYVAVPAGTPSQEFSFRVTSLDEQRESDVVQTRFDAPESE